MDLASFTVLLDWKTCSRFTGEGVAFIKVESITWKSMNYDPAWAEMKCIQSEQIWCQQKEIQSPANLLLAAQSLAGLRGRQEKFQPT